MYSKFLLTVSLLFFLQALVTGQVADCDPDNPKVRYRSRDFFASNQKISDVVYWDSGITQFAMDIYLPPSSDTVSSRPLVVWGHPGGFALGSKDTDTAILWCETLAKMGFVCASIDYRKEIVTDAIFGRAARAPYKAFQDARSAIRFLKANANTYGINPNDVYFAGASAGGVISINLAYMEDAERPSDTFGGLFFSDLGCLDCGANAVVNNSVFNGDIDGAIKLWGGVDDPAVVDGLTGAQTDDEPCLLIHGDLDETVVPDVGPPFQDDPLLAILAGLLFPDLFGTYPIRERLTNLGSNAPDWEAHVLCLEGHGFWVDKTNNNGGGNGQFGLSGIPDENFDYVVNEAIDFLARARGFNLEVSDDISSDFSTPTILAECDDESVGTYANTAFNEYFVVNPTPNHTYCWDLTKGTILEGQGTPNIKVRWDNTPAIATNRTGTILCYEMDENGAVFEASDYLVSIQDDENTSPNAAFTFSMASNANEFNFTNTSSSAQNSNWAFGDGTTSTAQNPSHTYPATIADYEVLLRVNNSNGAISEATQNLSVTGVRLSVKILLEGSYNSMESLMDNRLNQINQIPTTNPITDADLENLGASTTNDVLAITGNNAIVDWVRLELRSDANTIVQAKAALLQRDGDVVALDGSSAVEFLGIESGSYQVVVKHRNHIGLIGTAVDLD